MMLYRLAISIPQLRHVRTAATLCPVLVPSVWQLPSAPVFNWSQVASAGYNLLLVESRWLAAFVRKARASWLPAVFGFLSGLRAGNLAFHVFAAEELEAFQERILFPGCPASFTAKAQLVVWWFSYWAAHFCAGREPVFLFAELIQGDDVRHADFRFNTNRRVTI